MYKDYVGYYLENNNTLLPADSDVPSLVTELWYQYIKGKFDDMVWASFFERELFAGPKFSGDETTVYNNIVRTIKIRLLNKSRIYGRMFEAFMADYNPLWNVDGVTGTVRESKHTGTDTDVHSGTDELVIDDSDTNVKTGAITDEHRGTVTNGKAGTETTAFQGTESDTHSGGKTTVRSGSEEVEASGDDTTTNKNTTFDSGTFRDVNKAVTDYGKVDTKTYNDVTDTETYNQDTHNKTFAGRQDQLTYNTTDTQTLNNTDTQRYNDITDQRDTDGTHTTTYDSTLQKTLNLKDQDLEMVIRQGNIGVTKSSELLLDTLALYDNELMDFVHYVVNDCINQISYAVY